QCWTGFSGQLPGTGLIMQQQNIGKGKHPEGCPAWNQNCGRIAAASSFCKNVSHCKRRCRCKNNESFRPGKIGKPHSCTGQNRCSNGSFDDRPIKKIDRCKKQCNVRCLAHYFTGEISQGAPGYGKQTGQKSNAPVEEPVPEQVERNHDQAPHDNGNDPSRQFYIPDEQVEYCNKKGVERRKMGCLRKTAGFEEASSYFSIADPVSGYHYVKLYEIGPDRQCGCKEQYQQNQVTTITV